MIPRVAALLWRIARIAVDVVDPTLSVDERRAALADLRVALDDLDGATGREWRRNTPRNRSSNERKSKTNR